MVSIMYSMIYIQTKNSEVKLTDCAQLVKKVATIQALVNIEHGGE